MKLSLQVFDLSRSYSPSFVIHLAPLLFFDRELCESWDPRLDTEEDSLAVSESLLFSWLLSQLKCATRSEILLSGVVILFAVDFVTWSEF